jgi:DNA-binding XRE family transcriptional regulator
MAKKTKSPDPYFWQKPAYLKGLRERLLLSQGGLAKESGVTRSVIANYESGRSYLSSVDDALAMYRALELRERAQKVGQDAAAAVLRLLEIKREGLEGQLRGVEGERYRLEMKQKAAQSWLADVKSEARALEISRKLLAANEKEQIEVLSGMSEAEKEAVIPLLEGHVARLEVEKEKLLAVQGPKTDSEQSELAVSVRIFGKLMAGQARELNPLEKYAREFTSVVNLEQLLKNSSTALEEKSSQLVRLQNSANLDDPLMQEILSSQTREIQALEEEIKTLKAMIGKKHVTTGSEEKDDD